MCFGQCFRNLVIGSKNWSIVVPVDNFSYVVEAVQVVDHTSYCSVVSSVHLDEICEVLAEPLQFIFGDAQVARYQTYLSILPSRLRTSSVGLIIVSTYRIKDLPRDRPAPEMVVCSTGGGMGSIPFFVHIAGSQKE